MSKMSSHSRSSSEPDQVLFSEVLPVLRSDFIKDFSFSDVVEYVAYLFAKDELDAILKEDDEERQIVLLFWTLCRNEQIIPDFLKKISIDYKWLSKKVYEEQSSPSKSTRDFIEELKLIRSQHPKHTDYNVHRIDLFMKLQTALRKLKPHHKVVLEGDLGVGKKWLALDVCSDYNVMRAMGFRIFWLDMSECQSPEDDLRMLEHFRLLLGDDLSSSTPSLSGCSSRQICEATQSILNRKLFMQQSLRKMLRTSTYKNCLLVLMNVRNVKAVNALNLGCKLLIITRNKKIGESLTLAMTERISVKTGLTLNEFYCLFEKYLRCKRDQFDEKATDIYYNSNMHPLLLSIIAQNLYQRKSNWKEWIRNLENLQLKDNQLMSVVKISLNGLSPELRDLYQTFAIFPNSTSIFIPVTLLATIWKKTLDETKEIVYKFHNSSYVIKDVNEDNTMVCTLPFVYSTYLKKNENLINSLDLHRKIIDYYNIENALKHRTEIDFCGSQHDLYFFYCIGYHLKKGERTDLIPLLFLDFGFLERKIRTVGVSHTIRDLKYYAADIFGTDPRRRQLLNEICRFLQKVEEKVVQSKDTCLLQYAFMEADPVHTEALQQIKRFPDKVWFTEQGKFHRRREILSLPNQPRIVHFLEPDICLTVLDNNYIHLVDFSLIGCNGSTVIHTDTSNRNDEIIEVRIICNDRYILTLDKGGDLKLWSIADDYRRSKDCRSSSKRKVNPLNFYTNGKHHSRKCKQSVYVSVLGKRSRIVAFFVEQLQPIYNSAIYLHIVFENGDIKRLEWNTERDEFKAESLPVLQTHLKDIQLLCKILGKYYMILNVGGDNLTFWDLNNTSQVALSFDWPQDNGQLVHYEMYTKTSNEFLCVMFVFAHKILRLSFKKLRFFSNPGGKLETIYECEDVITCAKMSTDQRYVVLGTQQGLIVFDNEYHSEIIRSNVSETIACVDIMGLTDPIFKYCIICGSENKKALNIFGLKQGDDDAITWEHNVSNDLGYNDPQLEPNVWILGQKLYDISYDRMTLVAVDSKNRIHQVSLPNTSWSIIKPAETSKRITAITTYQDQTFAAYTNGGIFNLTLEVFEKPFTEAPITFLQLVDESILIASTETRISLVREVGTENEQIFHDFNIRKCFKLFEKFLLLIDDRGTILILDANDFRELGSHDDVLNTEIGSFALTGCDLKDSTLFLVTSTHTIYIYSFSQSPSGELKVGKPKISEKEDASKEFVTCLAASNDASLLAIGLSVGDIKVFKIADGSLNFIYRLQSHTKPIYDMKFSPSGDVLVSCSEQLCFWNIAYILNNSLGKRSKYRRSSRFSSQHSSDVEEVDEKMRTSCITKKQRKYLQIINNGGPQKLMATDMEADAAWQGKNGPADKSELLACIKFDGNRAEKVFPNADFTQFITIDNEGVFYHLLLAPQSLFDEDAPYSDPDYSTPVWDVDSVDLPLTGVENGQDIYDDRVRLT